MKKSMVSMVMAGATVFTVNAERVLGQFYTVIDPYATDFALAASGYRITAIPTNPLTGEQVIIEWQRPQGSVSVMDWFGIFRAGASDLDYIDWRYTVFRFGDTDYYFDTEGMYNLRYFRSSVFASEKVATSETIVVEKPVANPERVTNFPPRNGPVIAFGDSIVAGVGVRAEHNFVSLLSKYLGIPIQNEGKSGDTTAMGLARLQTAVLSENPSVVLLCLGGNDALQNVPIDQTVSNLTAIVRAIQDNGAVVVLIGVPRSLDTDEYAPEFRKVYETTMCAYVPNVLRGVFGNIFLSADLVHPNEDGHKIIAERVREPLARLIEPIGPARLLISRNNDREFRVSWFGKSDQTYTLFSSSDPSEGYETRGSYAGADKEVALTFPNNGECMFFKITERAAQ